jgi:hypothetical protein
MTVLNLVNTEALQRRTRKKLLAVVKKKRESCSALLIYVYGLHRGRERRGGGRRTASYTYLQESVQRRKNPNMIENRHREHAFDFME